MTRAADEARPAEATARAMRSVVAAFEALSKGLLNQRLQTHEGI